MVILMSYMKSMKMPLMLQMLKNQTQIGLFLWQNQRILFTNIKCLPFTIQIRQINNQLTITQATQLMMFKLFRIKLKAIPFKLKQKLIFLFHQVNQFKIWFVKKLHNQIKKIPQSNKLIKNKTKIMLFSQTNPT